MALFSRTKKKEEVKAATAPVAPAGVPVYSDHTHVLRSPRITEKASMAMEGGVYVFDVAPRANKKQIAAALKSVYKVTPRKIAIVNTRSKTVRNTRSGKYGTKSGSRKAYVYLMKGETITVT